tara:strand:- start:107659 stop:108156 length:498 start_codon:yes stop_codon:yes gene_type:complete
MSDFKNNLVQSADAAARVGVLFVAVALFAAMWESDSPPAEASDNHWLARRAGALTIDAAGNEPAESVNQTRDQIKAQPVFEPVSHPAVITQPYPMPVGIAPGEYRVVDSRGMTETLNVSAEMVSMQKFDENRDQYIIENGDRKIFFIRIRNENATASRHSGPIRR